MKASKGVVVDHIDHNTLSNRRCNLRLVTSEQNYANMGPHSGKSGYVGVYPRGRKFEAGITWQGEHFYLGRYDDPVEAAKARDRKAYELHGKHAYLNILQDFQRGQRHAGSKRRRAGCRHGGSTTGRRHRRRSQEDARRE
jgi:hypothetical protein